MAGTKLVDGNLVPLEDADIAQQAADLTDAQAARAAKATRDGVLADLRSDAQTAALLTRLAGMSNAEIDAWYDANITTLAGARTVQKAIIKVLALLIRNS